MLKFIYKQEPYYYEHVGGQAYDIQTEINMNEDASIGDIMDAIVRLTKTAGFRATKTSFLNAIEDIFEDREEY